VIVSHECRELLGSCLASLHAAPPSGPFHVVVVDNASHDGTPDLVRRDFAWADLVALGENTGFASATNAAIRRTSNPYVLALNPDTEVPEGALDALLVLMEAHPEVGACGPRLVRADGSLDHAARRSFPTIAGSLGHFSGLGRRDDAPAALAQYRAPDVEQGPVDAVNGAFMLLRRAALDQVGLFDEDYWMYMEDLDLCYRLAEAGWTTWYEPSVAVLHVKHGSSGDRRSPRLTAAFHAGMARFYRRHYAPQRNPLVNAAVYAGIGVKLTGSVLLSLAHGRR
jgi:N-acetylglucosaminyl-diphospho-decaprenol L-rhamnosyltransferase